MMQLVRFALLGVFAFGAPAAGLAQTPQTRDDIVRHRQCRKPVGVDRRRSPPAPRAKGRGRAPGQDRRRTGEGRRGDPPLLGRPAARRARRGEAIEKERHDLRRSIVVATATDGYQAVYSWAELFLSPIGDGAIVIFERDGAPLPPNEGPFAMLSLRDAQPGPRHVKWLERIEIRKVVD